MGKQYGLDYAEFHYYFPPGGTFPQMGAGERIEQYIQDHAERF